MPIDPYKFWEFAEDYYPPLTEDMIAHAESVLGVTLPRELIDLLKVKNGSYTLGFAHPMSQATSFGEEYVPLAELGGIGEDSELGSVFNLLTTEYMIQEWDLPERQVLLAGDGHFWISLDYRKGPVPSVAWIGSGDDYQIAPTFAAFLDGLVPITTYEPDDEDDDEDDED
jgi:hypothetical protein